MDNKFNFIDIEDIDKKEKNPEIEVITTPSEVKIDTIDNIEEKEVKNHKFHFSFEARIITRILIVLVLFTTACILIYKVVNHTADYKLKYNEVSNTSYEICMKDNTCFKDDTTYNSNNINIIKATFDYNTEYDKKIKYSLKYYISLEIRTYNDDKKDSIMYFKEKKLIDDIEITRKSDNKNIHEKVTIDYSKYKEEIKDIQGKLSECEVSLYIIEPNETRKISTLIIPLSKDTIEIYRNDTTNTDKTTDIKVNLWDKYSILYGVIASILILISLIIIYKTTRLVLRVTNNKSDYEQAIDDILKEYDNVIVVLKDGYKENKDIEVIKLESFEDLLKINNQINKPIIYSKINNIKSEFLIEDDKLYKVVMKESDYE